MGDLKVTAFFSSEKMSKVRWLPEPLMPSTRFLTGNWDMPNNYVRLWRLEQNEYVVDYNDYVPRCSDKVRLGGDITELKLMENDLVVASCSDGHIYLLQIQRAVEEDQLKEKSCSQLLHKFKKSEAAAPCTGISTYGKHIATVGEDGVLNIVDVDEMQAVSRIIQADSCALNAVVYVSQKEVLTANRMGIIRMFDVREAADSKASIAFMNTTEDDKRSNYISCLTSHPTQPHVVFAGSEEGSISVWDLRRPGFPASYLSAHTSAIAEIGFHHSDPTKFFSASDGGELWKWTQLPSMACIETEKTDNANPWLSGERTKSRISITSIISNIRKPINSFDTQDTRLICVSDTEAIYFVNNIM